MSLGLSTKSHCPITSFWFLSYASNIPHERTDAHKYHYHSTLPYGKSIKIFLTTILFTV